jgi:cell fate (sporulation/competence/biofilm development) regulator YlbF (YheA/YmcA/DUF963 family)
MTTDSVILPPALLVAAERLATTLAGVEPIAAFRQAKKRLEADPNAGELLERFQSVQADLRVRQARGTITQADVTRLRMLQRAVQSNQLIVEYAEAQQAATAYLPEINQEISQLLGVDFASLAGPVSC